MPRRLADRFRELHGGEAPRVFFAPGRVNLIGAHLDYSGGDVLPLAVDRGIYVAARARSDSLVRLASLDLPLRVEASSEVLGDKAEPAHGWAAFPLGIVRGLVDRIERPIGADLLFAGDLPMAAGLSSSAAIEVATAVAFDRLLGLEIPPREIALIAHRAENEFVGVKCGIMDQFASALGKDGHALWLHCRTQRYEHVPIDRARVEILVMDTKKPRPLVKTGFNERVHECADALVTLRSRLRQEPCLAEYRYEDLPAIERILTGKHLMRARHVVTEMRRIRDAVVCLKAHDLAGFGRLLDQSHESTRTDYEVSCAELDLITDAARACEGVFGARLVGAGFGGCAIALVAPGRAEAVSASVARAFEARFSVTPGFSVLHAGPGAREE
jgi:galactokinase